MIQSELKPEPIVACSDTLSSASDTRILILRVLIGSLDYVCPLRMDYFDSGFTMLLETTLGVTA